MSAAVTALAELSSAFRDQDVDRLLSLFSERPEVTYAGSELGECATGPADLAALLTRVLGRDEAYAFDLPDVRVADLGDALSVLAEGTGTAHTPAGEPETLPSRVTGVLVSERGRWSWLLLVGGEPVPRHAMGGAEGTRTPDPLVANEVRYQLRHSPKACTRLPVGGRCARPACGPGSGAGGDPSLEDLVEVEGDRRRSRPLLRHGGGADPAGRRLRLQGVGRGRHGHR